MGSTEMNWRHHWEVRDRSVGNAGENWEQSLREDTEGLEQNVGKVRGLDYCYGEYYREFAGTPRPCSKKYWIESWGKVPYSYGS